MNLFVRHDLPGIKASGWHENLLEIKLDGNILCTFHGVPEAEHEALLRSKDPARFLEELKARYPLHESKTVLG